MFAQQLSCNFHVPMYAMYRNVYTIINRDSVDKV